MFTVLFGLVLILAGSAQLVDLGVGPETRIRCRDITDIEELCKHKKMCLVVMPDLPKLCRSFKMEKYGK